MARTWNRAIARKKSGAGDALRRREDRRQRVDEADGDVVAIDVVALVRRLAVRPGDDDRASRASGSSSAATKRGRV